MNVGDKIKYLRVKNEWTQKELAQRADIGQSTLSEYEKNIKNVSVKMISKFSEIFGVDKTYFLTDNYEETPNIEINNKMIVEDLLDTLISRGTITDPNNIDKSTIDMLVQVMKKDIEDKLKKQH